MKNSYCSTPPLLSIPPRVFSLRRFVRVLVIFIVIGIIAVPYNAHSAHAGNSESAIETSAGLAACYGVYHVVRPGQTLYSIAAAYGTTAYRIAICNGLGSYSVYAGQALLVPIYRPYR